MGLIRRYRSQNYRPILWDFSGATGARNIAISCGTSPALQEPKLSPYPVGLIRRYRSPKYRHILWDLSGATGAKTIAIAWRYRISPVRRHRARIAISGVVLVFVFFVVFLVFVLRVLFCVGSFWPVCFLWIGFGRFLFFCGLVWARRLKHRVQGGI